MTTRAFARQAPTVLGSLFALTALTLVLPFGALAWALGPKYLKNRTSVATVDPGASTVEEAPTARQKPALRLVVSKVD